MTTPGSAASRTPTLAARGLILLVRAYQAARAGRRSPCRYDPSCSAYAVIALQRFGAARGTWLAARRLGRCHPWGGFGPDPVPEPPSPLRHLSPRP
jgi:putative membrane protein insertion efficiency factor